MIDRRFFLGFLVVLFLLSCKREEGEPPVLQLYSPAGYSTYMTGDTIAVSGQASSMSQLTYIKIVLLSHSYVQVNPPLTLYPQTDSYSFDVEYILSGQDIETGSYYLMVEAGNEYGADQVFVHVNVTGIPLESRALVVFCYEKADGQVGVYYADSLLQYSLLTQLGGDFCEGAVSSKDQMIYSMGQYTGHMYFLDASDGNVAKQIDVVQNPPFPYFESLTYSNGLLVIGYHDGRMEGYYGNGNYKFSYVTENMRARRVRYDGTYLLCVLEYYLGGAINAGVMWEISGMIKDVLYTEYAIADLYRVEGNQVALFANLNNQPSVKFLDTYHMTITHMCDLPPGEVISVADAGDHRFILSHTTGLLLYDAQANQWSLIESTAFSGKLAFDQTDQMVYMSSGRDVYAFAWPDGTLLGSVQMPDSVRDIHMLYNR